MIRVIFRLSAFFLFAGILSAQEYQSIHQEQAEYYRENYQEPQISGPAGPFLDKATASFAPSHTIFGYHPYWMGTDWQNYNYNLLTTVAWFSAEATPTGGLSNLHGWPVTGLINLAHSHGVDVVLCVTMFSSTSLTTLLSNSTNRTNLINNLVSQVRAGNADGVNVDFENLPSSQRNNMVQFITDLKAAFDSQIPGSQVTLATPAVDWSNAWDYNALANASDGLFIMGYAYHWSGSSYAGAVSPLTGGSINVTKTVNDYLAKINGQTDKLILGLPYYGREWQTVSGSPGAATTSTGRAVFFDEAEALAATYGRLWSTTSQTPWFAYQNTSWYQCWYDDSLSLSLKYDLAVEKNLQGVGMWALGYDGTSPKLWEALEDKFGSAIAPMPPKDLSVRNTGSGSVKVEFNGGSAATEYRVYRGYLDSPSLDQIGTYYENPFIIDGLTAGETYFIRISAANEFGETVKTEMLGVTPTDSLALALIINGFDRKSGTNNTMDFTRQHGSAFWSAGIHFDSASDEAILGGRIDLKDYPIVDWILGEESTVGSTLTPAAQELLKDYLENGGRLLISGSEIGWDLVDKGSDDDKIFYRDYLKAQYITDAAAGQSGVYQAYGAEGSIFSDISVINFDDGSHGTYDVDWPDGIKPAQGAHTCAAYTGVDASSKGGAAIYYEGRFGNGTADGAIVHMAIGFEAVYPAETRDQLMAEIVEFFDLTGTAGKKITESVSISSIYPNPAKSAVNIVLDAKTPVPGNISLTIRDILGRTVAKMVIPGISQDQATITWYGADQQGHRAASGVYLAVLETSDEINVRKFTLVK